MAFHIELGEVAKARAVAERALQTIHFRRVVLCPDASCIVPSVRICARCGVCGWLAKELIWQLPTQTSVPKQCTSEHRW